MSQHAWMDEALCAQTDPELFFSDSGHYQDAAKICRACPVRAACLEHVESFEGDVDYSRRFGLWASTTPRNRASSGRLEAIEERRERILQLHSAGHSVRAIATQVGVTDRAARHVLKRHRDGFEEAA